MQTFKWNSLLSPSQWMFCNIQRGFNWDTSRGLICPWLQLQQHCSEHNVSCVDRKLFFLWEYTSKLSERMQCSPKLWRLSEAEPAPRKGENTCYHRSSLPGTDTSKKNVTNEAGRRKVSLLIKEIKWCFSLSPSHWSFQWCLNSHLSS